MTDKTSSCEGGAPEADDFESVSVPTLLRWRDSLSALIAARMDHDERVARVEQAAGNSHNARLDELDKTPRWRPVLYARCLDDGRIAAWCPLCREEHIHRTLGIREPHCPEGTGHYNNVFGVYRVMIRGATAVTEQGAAPVSVAKFEDTRSAKSAALRDERRRPTAKRMRKP